MTKATPTLEAPPSTEGDAMEVQLKPADRCDRCGAQAFIRVVMQPGTEAFQHDGDLLFCMHHGRANEAILREKALKVYDYTATINQEPSASASV